MDAGQDLALGKGTRGALQLALRIGQGEVDHAGSGEDGSGTATILSERRPRHRVAPSNIRPGRMEFVLTNLGVRLA